MDELLAANRANWDDRTGVHVESRFYDVDGWLRDGRGPRQWEVDFVGDVTGQRLVHLQCHFGQDTLSWARAGAEVVGLDFSPAAIAAARELATSAGLADRATFVCANVLDAAEVLAPQTFDVVYVSMGALCWLPSVDRWATQVGALVAPGGRFYIHDGHPLAWSMSDDVEGRLDHGYFEETEPFVWDADTTYTDAACPIEHGRTYEWNHGIGEIVTALVRHGLVIDQLVEHPWTVCQLRPWLTEGEDGRWYPPTTSPKLPLSFSLLAHRPAGAT